jgi:hypothetical protein
MCYNINVRNKHLEETFMNTEFTKDFDIEEIEDFEANEEITYLVCALGYDENDELTNCEVYLKEFKYPDEAVAFAKNLDLIDLLQYAAEQKVDISETTYFSLEVETVVECEDREGGTENIDTIWETQINIG